MEHPRESLKPVAGADRNLRRRLALRQELVLALLPTVMILLVLAFLEALSNQRILFASLASSAFLIYLDPLHGMNTVRSLVTSHVTAAIAGVATFWLLGHGYSAAAAAMVVTIIGMIVLDAVHPPAVATSLSFAFRSGAESEIVLFGLALTVVALLVVLERAALWLLARLRA